MKVTIKIIVLFIASLSLYSCGGSDSYQEAPSNPTTTPSGDGNDSDNPSGSLVIKRATSSAELESYLRASLIQNYANQMNAYPEYELASSAADSTSATDSSPSSFSSTNTQESSVDEGDRLKTDGNYLYTSSIYRPDINIFQADASATNIATHTLDTLNQVSLSSLYLRDDENQLLAISGDGAQNLPMWDMWFGPYYWQDRKTEVFMLDVSDPAAPEQQAKLTLDGQLVSSRRIGSTLYLATRHTPSIEGMVIYPYSEDDLSMNEGLINSASLEDMLPTYQINGGSEQALFEASDCFISGYSQPLQQQSSIISLLAIDLDAATPTPRGQCFAGDAETVYASGEALYLATTRYTYNDENGVAIYNGQPSTEIHKFSLEGTVPDYRGTGSVNGHLGWQQDLKPFRMSEYNDVLRVITYTGEQADSHSSPAHLYTLQENTDTATLDTLASLPNDSRPDPLGKPGEQIYATRFIGERAYLVTFRMTDPLYIVDLSDPADPFIASELEINGYSDYLHPVGDNYLLGIGKDAVASSEAGDGRGAWFQGVKLSLIDVSDASAPFEKQQIILGKRGSETAVSRTHHALTSLFKGESLELALPVSIHDTPNNYNAYTDESNPAYYYSWTRSELYRLSINTITGAIEELPAIGAEHQTPNDYEYYQPWEWPYDRSAIIDDRVYYLQGDEVSVN